MKIGSISEDLNLEKRISITPEIAKKYIDLGFELQLTNNYGSHLGFKDDDYKDAGVKFLDDNKSLIESSDILVQMGLTNENNLANLKPNQSYIGVLNPYENAEKLKKLSSKTEDKTSFSVFSHLNRIDEDPSHIDFLIISHENLGYLSFIVSSILGIQWKSAAAGIINKSQS